MKELKKYLEKIAANYKERGEDFDPGNGGNFNDTYDLGWRDGESYMAKYILEKFINKKQ